MTWLTKEMTDTLSAMGYVAVPKECIQKFWAQATADPFEMMLGHDAAAQIARNMRERLSLQIGDALMRAGYLDHESYRAEELSGSPFCHRVSLNVLRPRVITPENRLPDIDAALGALS